MKVIQNFQMDRGSSLVQSLKVEWAATWTDKAGKGKKVGWEGGEPSYSELLYF